MLIELARAVGGYLHDVFVTRMDWWVLLGFVAQAFFTARFAVQWIVSERAGKSVVPLSFWWLSIGGGVLLLAYALYRRDPVFIAGQGFGVFVYARNLFIRSCARRRSALESAVSRVPSPRSPLQIGDQVGLVLQADLKAEGRSSPGAQGAAVRYSVQSNRMARLSKPPQEWPMPNKVSPFRNAYDCFPASAFGRCRTGRWDP